MNNSPFNLGVSLAAIFFSLPGSSADIASALDALRRVGPEGHGHAAATAAWSSLSQSDASHLTALLSAMDGAGDLSRNWLFTAANAIVDRTLQAGNPLPLPSLADFLLNTSHDPRARRLALDLIARGDNTLAEVLIPGLLDDPSTELRREAVQRLIDRANKTLAEGRKDPASVLFQQASAFARDADQIEALTKPLKELGRPVDLVQQLGFLVHWKVIGPFDNTGGAGFDRIFPPESEIKFDTEYDGKEGKVRWKDFASTHEMGMVDFNKAYAPIKEVTGYAFTEFHSDAPKPAEIRLGSKNGWKVWFNGKYLFGRDEYHRGVELDQYKLPVQLQPGRNTLLVKVTQNEQKEDWTVEWEFQIRITDPNGRVIRSAPVGVNVGTAF